MNRVDLEERVYRSRFTSGLLEIFVGAALVLIGLGWLTGHLAIVSVVPVLLALLWPSVTSRVVSPRAGRVTFRAPRKRRERRGLVIMALLGGLTFVALVALLVVGLGSESLLARDLVRGLPAFLLAVGSLVAASVFGIRRTYFYAIPLLVGAALSIVLRIDPGWSLLGSGVVIFLAGAVFLFGFVRNRPVMRFE